MGDPIDDVGREATRALEDVGENALEALLQSLKNDKPMVRRRALEVLTEIANENTVPNIAETLEDDDISVVNQAIETLIRIKTPNALKFLKRAFYIPHDDIDISRYTFDDLDSEFLPYLRELLEDSNPLVRRRATDTLSGIKNLVIVNDLVKLIEQDEDIEVRRQAVRGLANIRSEKALKGIARALSDRSEWVIRTASRELGDMGTIAIKYLKEPLKSKSPQTVIGAIEALGDIGTERCIKLIIGCLDSPDADIRASAIQALGNIKGEDVIPGLIQGIADGNGKVVTAAKKNLKEMGSLALSQLIDLAKNHNNPQTRMHVIEVIGNIGSRDAVDDLVSLIENNQNVTVQTEEGNKTLNEIIILSLEKTGSKKAKKIATEWRAKLNLIG